MTTESPLPDWDRLDFSFKSTDAIYRCEGSLEREGVWAAGEMLPYAPVALSPASAFFSYGLGVFEGLKAHRTEDGRVLIFRPRDNAARFQRSAERLLMPPFPESSFLDAVQGVVRRNLRFLPPAGKGSFYLRPLELTVEPKVGIAPGSEFWVLIFGVPVGEYFASTDGVRLKVLAQGRVAPGGTGSAKAMGNYAGGMAVAQPWKARGFDDVLYLDARHVRYLTETSGSNVFVRMKDGEVVTPPLDDQILAGITRDSVIRVCRELLGLTVRERSISIDEALDSAVEIFATGTAWTVKAVAELDYQDRVSTFASRDLQQELLGIIRGIQRGEKEDAFGWIHEVSHEAESPEK